MAQSKDDVSSGTFFSEGTAELQEPNRRTVMESVRFAWSHGGRRLILAWFAFLFVALISGMVASYSLFRNVESASSDHPYEVRIPVQILDRVDGVEGPATNTGSITASIDGCNTTDGVIVLNFSGQWVKYNQNQDGTFSPSHLAPLAPIVGVTTRSGGSLCDERVPVEVRLDLPDAVRSEEGLWQLSVQVDVYGCDEVNETSFGGMQCARPTDPIDHMGWYSERFEVIP